VQFELTADEYREYHSGPRTVWWKRVLLWLIAIGLFVGPLLIGQYAFAIAWAAILIIFNIVGYRTSGRLALHVRSTNPFQRGPIHVELSETLVRVIVGSTDLKLGLEEMGRIHKYPTYYHLAHKSGVSLKLPKRAAAPEEVEILEAYYARFPGTPAPPKSLFDWVS
jgi:hypothetical protein